MKQDKAIEFLTRQRDAIASLRNEPNGGPSFTKWQRDTEVAIERIFGPESRNLHDFKDVRFSLSAFTISTPESEFEKAYREGLKNAEAVLDSMLGEIADFGLGEDAPEDAPDVLSLIEKLCLRFHKVARQLQNRHASRTTIEINDEYDVQDLLHAILRLHFDDVRPEEWGPSYAGSGSRVDFLLPAERIVIEVKKTRDSLKTAALGDQLIIDQARYRRHPDCDTLVCFVYDPEGRIGNPVGIERDLEGVQDGLRTRVIIAPRG